MRVYIQEINLRRSEKEYWCSPFSFCHHLDASWQRAGLTNMSCPLSPSDWTIRKLDHHLYTFPIVSTGSWPFFLSYIYNTNKSCNILFNSNGMTFVDLIFINERLIYSSCGFHRLILPFEFHMYDSCYEQTRLIDFLLIVTYTSRICYGKSPTFKRRNNNDFITRNKKNHEYLLIYTAD